MLVSVVYVIIDVVPNFLEKVRIIDRLSNDYLVDVRLRIIVQEDNVVKAEDDFEEDNSIDVVEVDYHLEIMPRTFG